MPLLAAIKRKLLILKKLTCVVFVVFGRGMPAIYYHRVVETPDGNLSSGMRHLNGVYTQRFNCKHKWVGHLFQGRYKVILVDKDRYLLELCQYVVLNLVRAHRVEEVGDWSWSSYLAMTGKAPGFEALAIDATFLQFRQ